MLTASEALYGFMGWLTSRKEVVTFSGSHEASTADKLVGRFCAANNLPSPRDDWLKELVRPREYRNHATQA